MTPQAPAHNAVPAHLSRQTIADLKRSDINQGKFTSWTNAAMNSFADTKYKGLKPSKELSLEKTATTSEERSLFNQLRKIEKAVQCRGSLVGEMANDGPDLDKAIATARKLLDQGVKPAELNWRMGTPKTGAEALQQGVAKNALANLARLYPDLLQRQLSPEVLEVFHALQEGLSSPGPSNASQVPATGAAQQPVPTGQPLSQVATGAQVSPKLLQLKNDEAVLGRLLFDHAAGKPVFASSQQADMARLKLEGIVRQIKQLETSAQRHVAPVSARVKTPTPPSSTAVAPLTPRTLASKGWTKTSAHELNTKHVELPPLLKEKEGLEKLRQYIWGPGKKWDVLQSRLLDWGARDRLYKIDDQIASARIGTQRGGAQAKAVTTTTTTSNTTTTTTIATTQSARATTPTSSAGTAQAWTELDLLDVAIALADAKISAEARTIHGFHSGEFKVTPEQLTSAERSRGVWLEERAALVEKRDAEGLKLRAEKQTGSSPTSSTTTTTTATAPTPRGN